MSSFSLLIRNTFLLWQGNFNDSWGKEYYGKRKDIMAKEKLNSSSAFG